METATHPKQQSLSVPPPWSSYCSLHKSFPLRNREDKESSEQTRHFTIHNRYGDKMDKSSNTSFWWKAVHVTHSVLGKGENVGWMWTSRELNFALGMPSLKRKGGSQPVKLWLTRSINLDKLLTSAKIRVHSAANHHSFFMNQLPTSTITREKL